MLSEDRVDLGPRINRRLASVVMIKRVGTLAKRRWSADCDGEKGKVKRRSGVWARAFSMSNIAASLARKLSQS